MLKVKELFQTKHRLQTASEILLSCLRAQIWQICRNKTTTNMSRRINSNLLNRLIQIRAENYSSWIFQIWRVKDKGQKMTTLWDPFPKNTHRQAHTWAMLSSLKINSTIHHQTILCLQMDQKQLLSMSWILFKPSVLVTLVSTIPRREGSEMILCAP